MNATTQDHPTNPNYAAQCSAHARAHADKAQALVEKSESKMRGNAAGGQTLHATQATAHATLALFWQGEAGRS